MKQASAKMVSSATNGMWPSGSASVLCAATSVICCATPLRLVASSWACVASLAASPAILSFIRPLLGLAERGVHDLAALCHQGPLHHFVVEIDLQRLGLLVYHGRDEVQEVARKQRRGIG